MVAHLAAPRRPLRGGRAWTWRPGDPWFRLYHRDDRTPDALAPRRYGPLLRFDPHTPPPDAPADCPAGRTAIYLARALRTAGAEVFGDLREAALCPSYRAALVRPSEATVVQNVRRAGSMAIGALPALSTADLPRAETQAWARAIYEDRPAHRAVAGIRYTGAHDEGDALVLWDTAPPLALVQDVPLRDPAVLRRFLVAMSHLEVAVSLIDSAECRRCLLTKDRLSPSMVPAMAGLRRSLP